MAESKILVSCDVVTCSLCLETFKEPKVLPCFHTFCFSCLKDYTESRNSNIEFPCPLCKKNVKIPNKDVKTFPNNFLIQKMLDEVEKKPTNNNAQIEDPESDTVIQSSKKNQNDNGNVGSIHTKTLVSPGICHSRIALIVWTILFLFIVKLAHCGCVTIVAIIMMMKDVF